MSWEWIRVFESLSVQFIFELLNPFAFFFCSSLMSWLNSFVTGHMPRILTGIRDFSLFRVPISISLVHRVEPLRGQRALRIEAWLETDCQVHFKYSPVGPCGQRRASFSAARPQLSLSRHLVWGYLRGDGLLSDWVRSSDTISLQQPQIKDLFRS